MRLVVVDVAELKSLVAEAVREALGSKPVADDYVCASDSPLGSPWTFRRLAKEGAFPVSRVGRKLVARRADVVSWIASQRQAVTTAEPEGNEIDAMLASGRLRAIGGGKR